MNTMSVTIEASPEVMAALAELRGRLSAKWGKDCSEGDAFKAAVYHLNKEMEANEAHRALGAETKGNA